MTGHKILIIDDSPEVLEFLNLNLSSKGFFVFETMCGEDALEAIKHSRPNLIICDYLMPGINGLETCKALRKVPSLKETPIILFSSFPFEANHLREMNEIGIDRYLPKPCSFNDLADIIQDLLEIPSLQA